MDVVPSNFMTITSLGFDDRAYNYEWTGDRGIFPYTEWREIINPVIQGRDLIVVGLFADAPDNPFWVAEDRINIMTSRNGLRLGANGQGLPIRHFGFRVGFATPYDTLAFRIRPKQQAYDLTIYVGPLTDDIGSSEYRVEV